MRFYTTKEGYKNFNRALRSEIPNPEDYMIPIKTIWLKNYNMKDYQKELLLLKERKDQLMKTINSHSFSSEKEYNLFVKENINMFVELIKITKEIKNIQWKLMNDIEKQNYLDYLKELKEKFNETEFY